MRSQNRADPASGRSYSRSRDIRYVVNAGVMYQRLPTLAVATTKTKAMASDMTRADGSRLTTSPVRGEVGRLFGSLPSQATGRGQYRRRSGEPEQS
jgi:hypothetical protein